MLQTATSQSTNAVHYVVVDFEATCDEPYNPEPQEIIEFPAIVVTPDGALSEPFHQFVRPVAHPTLSTFCQQLTGITQAQIAAAAPFPLVLQAFDDWLARMAPTPRQFVTCGNWDLGSILPRQCHQHGLPIPAWAQAWCNLKNLFGGEHKNLLRLLAAVGLEMEGRWHSGLDDTRNIARIVQRLQQRGAALTNNLEWRCRTCDTDNSPTHKNCVKCGDAATPLLLGDWYCPQCHFANFARRRQCMDCGTRRR